MPSLKWTPIVMGTSCNSQLFPHLIFSITEKKGQCSLLSQERIWKLERSRIKQPERSLGSLSKQSAVCPVRSGEQAPRCHSLKSQK